MILQLLEPISADLYTTPNSSQAILQALWGRGKYFVGIYIGNSNTGVLESNVGYFRDI